MALTLVTSDLIHGLDYSKLTGTIPTWNQNTTGNAATATLAAGATILATARNIGGVSFNGSAAIDLPGVNAAGNQPTSGNAGSVTNGVYTVGDQTIAGVKTFSSSVTVNGPRYLVQRSNDDSSIAFANNASGSPSSHTWAVGLNYSNSNAFTIAYGSSGIPSLESSKLVMTTGGNVGIGTTSPSATLHVNAPATTAPSLTMGASAGQIFENEDLEFAFGLNNASPYNGWMQTRFNGNAARNFAINPLGGNVGIGTNSPGDKLHVENGNIRLKSNSDGATGILKLYDAAGAESGQVYPSGGDLRIYSPNDVIFNNGGNVGIGNTNPSRPLDITADSGAVALKIRARSANDFAYMSFYNHQNTVLWSEIFAKGTSSATTSLNFVVGSTTPQLTVTSGGNVGIGTNSPGSKLELRTDTSSGGYGVYPALTIRNDNSSGYSAIHFNQGSTQKARLEVNNSAGTLGIFAVSGTGLSLSSGGDVGIGTTSPSQKLTVEGNIFIGTNGSLSWAGKGSYVTSVPGNAAGYIYSSARNPDNGTGTFPFNQYGEMVFQGNPRSGYNGGFTWVTGQAAYAATVAPTIKMVLTTAGDVGIGVASPTEKLEVAGAVRVRRKVLGWYQVVVPNNNNYWHVKTSLWAGGSPNGNTHYTMSHLHAELYSYSTAAIREGRQGWHNWSGTQHNIVNTGNIWSNPYTSSDGYVVLVLNTSGTYIGLNIDWSQVYTYTYVDIHVQSASGSSNTTGVY